MRDEHLSVHRSKSFQHVHEKANGPCRQQVRIGVQVYSTFGVYNIMPNGRLSALRR